MIFQYFHLFLLINLVSGVKYCYWNSKCPYLNFGSKTPYDSVRGDIRDYEDPPNCQAISLWILSRHGNRNPGDGVVDSIKKITEIKDEIIESFEQGKSQLCAQDVEDIKEWQWNEAIESSVSFLTRTGFEELYKLGKRIQDKYPNLIKDNSSNLDSLYYFRPTNEERTVTSALAFIKGLTDGTNLILSPDKAQVNDEVIRPYEKCEKYQKEVKSGPVLQKALSDFANSKDFISVTKAVQDRLGVEPRLSGDDVFNLYELCRFDRSWSEKLRSPWCSLFTAADLKVLEYRDDVKHFFRNGYGSWINPRLGELALKDLLQNFQNVSNQTGKTIVTYFTHDTMIEMVLCALGLYKDSASPYGTTSMYDIHAGRTTNRVWRTSQIACTATNIIAILYNCLESDKQIYKFQLLHNEKPTPLCPASGCSWEEFEKIFKPFTNATLEICDLNYEPPKSVISNGSLKLRSESHLLQILFFLLPFLLLIY